MGSPPGLDIEEEPEARRMSAEENEKRDVLCKVLYTFVFFVSFVNDFPRTPPTAIRFSL